MQLVTEDNITDLAVQRWGTAHDPRTAEIMTALVRHLHDFAREVRAHRGRVDGRGPVAHPHRPDQRREARGVHPRLRRARPVDARGADEPPPRPGRHPGHGARPVPHRRLPGAGLRRRHVRRPARARRSTSAAPSATWTASPSRAPCWTSGRPTTTARTRPSSRSTRPGCGRSTRPARTARTACARSRRWATRSHGRAGRRADRPHRDQPLPARARALPASPCPATSR